MQDNASAYNAGAYDGHIASVLPYYAAYHEQTIDLVRAMGRTAPDWLDTGCGTGTLALRALEAIPGARFTLCDPSEKMLDEARKKLAGRDVRYLGVPSDRLPYDAAFDVVTAIQSHHYYRPEDRERAVRRCCRALRESGVFIAFENVRMSDGESDGIAVRRWIAFMEAHGIQPEEIRMQLERRGTEVHPITIEAHLGLLKRCGFRSVNLLWASCLQAGFWALK